MRASTVVCASPVRVRAVTVLKVNADVPVGQFLASLPLAQRGFPSCAHGGSYR